VDTEKLDKIFKLTTGSGVEPRAWEAAVAQQIERVRVARDELRGLTPAHGPIEPMQRIEYEAHFLLVAIRNVVRSAHALRAVIGQGPLADAITEFEQRFPEAADFRDYATHFDEYQLGEGRHQRTGAVPVGSSLWLSWWSEGGRLILHFGGGEMYLEDAATAARGLAQTAHKEWVIASGRAALGPDEPEPRVILPLGVARKDPEEQAPKALGD
jgi:hypothetical protein